MKTSVSFEKDICTVAISGRIDTLTAPALESVFREVSPKSDKVIFDMADVEYISSAGMRVLIIVHREMSAKGGFVLRHPTKNVMTILSLTGFDKVLNIEV